MSILLSIQDDSDLYYWLALERIPRVGPLTIAKLIKIYSHPKRILSAKFADLRQKTGFSEKLCSIISEYSPPQAEIEKDIELLKKTNTNVVLFWDNNYPENLKNIYDPPALLFVRGSVYRDETRAVGIVGTRQPTNYGLDVVAKLTRELVDAGVTIVSGVARGIDTAAHKSALKAGGRTIGVLGCGINVVYPRENKALIEEMAEKGAVVSEFRPNIQPLGTNFYRRNRIISGISKGVVVIEAAMSSGSLITAKHALDQNRDVFAVPGNAFNSKSAGPHHLLKQGAGLVETAADVLDALFPETTPTIQASFFSAPQTVSVSDDAERILHLIDLDPIPIDLICEGSGMDAGKVSGLLVELELSGLIRQLPGKLFAKIPGN